MIIDVRDEIEIDAPNDVVWEVLTDTDRYGEWNPFIRRLGGELREGATLEVEIAPPGGRKMTFKPTVLVAAPGRELRWLGRLLLPGLFDGEHRLELEPLSGGRTRFIQSERFSGILVRPFRSTIDKTRIGFEQMNQALKAKTETRAARPT